MAQALYDIIVGINKQIKDLCCKIQTLKGDKGDKGDPGEDGAPGGFGAYGSYYSTVDQINTANGTLPMTLNTTDFESDISVVSGSRITMANAGKYNIAFSAQFHNTGGGGSGTVVNIWLAKNGNPVPDSSTRVTVNTNSPYVVSAWNFFVNAIAGDYYQIMWTTNNANIILEREDANAIHPAIPSVIITVNQVG
jgi:hypothetical protein